MHEPEKPEVVIRRRSIDHICVIVNGAHVTALPWKDCCDTFSVTETGMAGLSATFNLSTLGLTPPFFVQH
jgi:hypothetical protein